MFVHSMLGKNIMKVLVIKVSSKEACGMQIRHLFAGSNSGEGFHSLFDNIIGPDARRVYLLKGGPGTGKSRFMREIADSVGRGYDQELFFCSSDSQSLDAVTFPELGVALIDATAPHAQDAEWPGCRDQLLSLGDFWSRRDLEEKRAEIMAVGLIKRAYFAEAFHYFAAANCLEQNIAARSLPRRLDCAQELENILAQIPVKHRSCQAKPGQTRHLFASALTPEGYVSHIKSLVGSCTALYVLTGAPGSGKSECISAIAGQAQDAGLDMEVFHYPLNPKKLLHVLISSLKLAVLTATEFEPLDDLKVQRVACGESLSTQGENAGDRRLCQELIDRGIQALKMAQASHVAVEEYYAASMDFAALNTYRDQVLAEILSYKNFS